MLPLNHPNRIQIAFDDHRLVANAGVPDRRQLVLPARCLKSNVTELRSRKVPYWIQPRNGRWLAGVVRKPHRNTLAT